MLMKGRKRIQLREHETETFLWIQKYRRKTLFPKVVHSTEKEKQQLTYMKIMDVLMCVPVFLGICWSFKYPREVIK